MMAYEESKTAEYIETLERHVLIPLRDTGLAQSCYATCMLLFSCIDGLGRLLHPTKSAGAGERFKFYLANRMGGNYDIRQSELWKLRNALDHNAIAALTFLSHMNDSDDEHLTEWDGWVFINTTRFRDDFIASVKRLKKELVASEPLLQQMDSRLVKKHIPPRGWRHDGPKTTPPPGIDFLTCD